MKTILSIDYDYWAEHDAAENDWSHHESPFFIHDIWSLRAIDALANGGLARICRLSRYDIRPAQLQAKLESQGWNLSGPLAIAESHASIVPWLKAEKLLQRPIQVINLDAHCDWGYDSSRQLSCGNWVQILARQRKLSSIIQVYPGWLDYRDNPDRRPEFAKKQLAWEKRGIAVEVCSGADLHKFANLKISGVFICRSGAWSPPWLDGGFQALVDSFIQHYWTRPVTLYNLTLTDLRRRLDWKELRAGRSLWRKLGRFAVGSVPVQTAISLNKDIRIRRGVRYTSQLRGSGHQP